MENIRKRMRFSEQDDLILLREVLGQNPFENNDMWQTIQENVRSVTKKDFSVRTIKDHLELLIKLWLKDIDSLKGSSGIEYQETEKQTLCGEIYYLMKEFKCEVKKKTKKFLDESKQLGILARDKAAATNFDHNYLGDCSDFTNEVEVFDDCNVDTEDFHLQIQENSAPEYEIVTDFKEVLAEPQTSRSAHLGLRTPNNNISPALQDAKSLTRKTPTAKKNDVNKEALAAPQTSRSDVLGRRKRGRSRGLQGQSLAYLESYDKQHFEIRERELKLEEKKIEIEEKKLNLNDQQFQLTSFETKKKMELLEKQINAEIESRRFLEKNIERQDKLINLLLKLN